VAASDGASLSKVVATWNTVIGATSYEVYRGATSDSGSMDVIATPAGTAFDDTTALPGITYYYRVKACSGANCSAFSTYNAGWRNFAAPASVAASDGTSLYKVSVSWAAVAGATSYKVYRGTTSDSASMALKATPAGTVYDDTATVAGFTYYYRVKACIGTNCSAFSTYNAGWRSFAAPTSVAASDGTSLYKVAVTWNAVSGATSYKVYRGATSDTAAMVLKGNPAGTAFDDTTATAGVVYFYRVKACIDTNCSGFSAYNSGWRGLAIPTNVQASDGTYSDKVAVTWNAVTGATSYQVYRGATSNIGAMVLIGSPAGTTFDDTTAAPGVTYYYRVKACNGAKCSDFSSYNAGWMNP
jgi:fibronectin type 3 domain-containing protein